MLSSVVYSKRLTLVPTRVLQMSDEVLCVKVSADSRLLAVSLLDNTIKVFFLDTLKVTAPATDNQKQATKSNHSCSQPTTTATNTTARLQQLQHNYNCNIFTTQLQQLQCNYNTPTTLQHYYNTASTQLQCCYNANITQLQRNYNASTTLLQRYYNATTTLLQRN